MPDFREPLGIERNGRILCLGERNGRRRKGLASSLFVRCDLGAALPRYASGSFTPCVRQLNRENLLCSIVRDEFNISGLQNKTVHRHLSELSSGQVSRLLKRLRSHGLIKKVGHTYKYYVTAFGKEVVATALKLRELVIIPQLAFGAAQ